MKEDKLNERKKNRESNKCIGLRSRFQASDVSKWALSFFLKHKGDSAFSVEGEVSSSF